MRRFNQAPTRKRRGAALLVVVLAVIVVAALAGALMGVTVFSEKESVTTTSLSRALYVAEAGVSECVAAVQTGSFDTTGATAAQMVVGTAAAPIAFSGGTYFATSDYDPTGSIRITSFGTVGGRTRGIESVLLRNLNPIYRSAIFAGNSDDDPTYDLNFSGLGTQADDINGDVYSGGNIVVQGDADIDGNVRADGTITGDTGETGVSISPPDLASMNYEVNNNVDVAAIFATDGALASSVMGGNAWQVPEENPAHIFRKNPDDRTANTSTTAKDDYFLEDPYEAMNGSSTIAPSGGTRITLSGLNGEPGPSGSDLVYYIDGNLWVHNPSAFSFTLFTATGEPARLTLVVKGNIYISDNIFYQNPDQDGLALIAMKDAAEPDSGNIYFGDPSFGTLEYMDAFMFAENNFHDNNLSATGSAKVTVNGNMTAGNQVNITRDFGDQHSKLTVNLDSRLARGAVQLPGLPGMNPGVQQWSVAAWREIAVP